MRWFKIILRAFFVCFLIIQFIQPDRSKKVSERELAFTSMYRVPQQVQHTMLMACNNCHSNETTYPWYTYIQPIGWYLNKHIKNGRAQLNLSEFGKYSSRERISKIKEMISVVKNDEMPMTSYTMMHKEATLQPADKGLLMSWLGHLEDSLLVN